METAREFIKRKESEDKAHPDKSIPFKDIGRKGRHIFKIEARTFMRQHNLPQKVFVFERLRRVKTEGRITHKKLGKIEYRIGYYIIGKTGNKKGTWTWGQYCPLIPPKDFRKLLDKAQKEKVLK